MLYSPSKKIFVRGCFASLRFGRICIPPLCVSCVPLLVAYAVELMARGVIWMSAHWPSSLFVLAVTFSLCLCQNYPLCWVLGLREGSPWGTSLQAGTKCGVWNSGTSHGETWMQGEKQVCSSSAPLLFLSLCSLTSSEEQSLTFAFHFIQGKWSLAVHSYYLFIISHLRSCYPGFLEWFICINVFKHCKQWFSS